MRRLGAVVSIAIAVLIGCTTTHWDTSQIDSPTTSAPKRYAKTESGVTASLTAYLSRVGGDLDEWAPSKVQAQCAAERLVRRLTVGHLLDLGFNPNKPSLALRYPVQERTSVVNILMGCIDFAEGVLEMYSSYQKLPLTESNCMSEGYKRLGLDRDLVGSLIDGKEPDPFANSNHFASGLGSVAVDCMQPDDLLPAGAIPLLPAAGPDSPKTTTSTTLPPLGGNGDIGGIVKGGPLDTTSTTPKGR